MNSLCEALVFKPASLYSRNQVKADGSPGRSTEEYKGEPVGKRPEASAAFITKM